MKHLRIFLKRKEDDICPLDRLSIHGFLIQNWRILHIANFVYVLVIMLHYLVVKGSKIGKMQLVIKGLL
jgi:hypothetical protein